MGFIEIIACFIVFIGVVIAIAYGNNKNNKHRWELVEGSIVIGILLGISAAFCQAVGLIMMKPIFTMGADPIASAAIRTTISAFLISFTFFYNTKIIGTDTKLTAVLFYKTIIVKSVFLYSINKF